jgi:RNA polymerase sigma-70 factor (ECF subfamily)
MRGPGGDCPSTTGQTAGDCADDAPGDCAADDSAFGRVTDPVGDPAHHRAWVRAAVDVHERKLVAYAAHLTGNLEQARDVVQETFARLCDADRPTVEPRLAQWLFTVARNLAIDERRRRRRTSPIDDAPADAVASAAAGPLDAAETGDATTAVLAALAALPPVQQEAVRLKFHHGLSYKEIAAVLDLTVTNVGFILHTALKALRARLDDGPPPGQRGHSHV